MKYPLCFVLIITRRYPIMIAQAYKPQAALPGSSLNEYDLPLKRKDLHSSILAELAELV